MGNGAQALAALERALAAQPERDGDAFSEATEQLCRMRNALIARGNGGETLDNLNAVISATLAGHFPLGETPWQVVQSAADTLRGLVATLDA